MIQLRHSRGPVTGSRATYGGVTRKRRAVCDRHPFRETQFGGQWGGVARVGVLAESNEGVHLESNRGSRMLIRVTI
jgi:hypothetical protein